MSNKNKDKIIIFQSIILLIIIIAGCIYFGPKLINKINNLHWLEQYLEVNENISDLQFYDINNNIADFNDKYKLMIYLSKDCNTCISNLPNLKRLNETFGKDQPLELMLMWVDETPNYELMEYYGLLEHSFKLNDTHIAESFSTLFLLDENNNIIYMVYSDYESMLDKIIELNILDEDKLISNANQYIKDNLTKNYSGNPDLIYFSMPGCPDCADANPIIYSDVITNVLHVTRIELVKGAEPYDIKDEFSIFRKIYKIDWYPSFLVIENDGKWGIVRKVELAELQKNILLMIE